MEEFWGDRKVQKFLVPNTCHIAACGVLISLFHVNSSSHGVAEYGGKELALEIIGLPPMSLKSFLPAYTDMFKYNYLPVNKS